jgi:4-alpha-glucanotransferase
MRLRGSGILLHITSLPSSHGIGDLGPEAYAFADFLAETRQSYWQILPLNPTGTVHGNSPYSSISAFAGNQFLISPELLIREGFLKGGEVVSFSRFPDERVDYTAVISHKEKLFHLAFNRFKKRADKSEYERFCATNSEWLNDFSLFVAIKSQLLGKSWGRWPRELRDRKPEAIIEAQKKLRGRIEREKFLQHVFFTQLFSLKKYCNEQGIKIIGDIPMYVAHDSADVWASPHLFKLNKRKRLSVVSGSPPDIFFKTGQVWGNPVYRWDVLKNTGYDWWYRRLKYSLARHDVIRIDHFRGFVAYWEVPVGEKTGVNGQWVDAPAADFFEVLCKKFFHLPVIAEDLGRITADIREIMSRFGFPGMRPIISAFSENPSRHISAPHKVTQNTVVYTGTHDFNTIRGWFEKELTAKKRKRLFRYIGREAAVEDIHWELIRLATMTVANTAIIPMQDILGLDGRARMNRPGTAEGNWEWRLLPGQLRPPLIGKLKDMTKLYGRD